MKRTSINLLCILIIGILSVSVLLPAYYLGASFTEGFRMGYEMADDRNVPSVEMQALEVYFEPSAEMMLFPKDTITFDDGRRIPVVVKRASILADKERIPTTPIWLSGGCYVLSLVCLVLLVIKFVKFIININKGKIFVQANVKLLRAVSFYLIAISVLNLVTGLAGEYMVSALGLSLEGYAVSAYWTLPWSNLLIGLLALLVAQIWSRGISLEEEVRLTV